MTNGSVLLPSPEQNGPARGQDAWPWNLSPVKGADSLANLSESVTVQQSLHELEDGFFRFWLQVNSVTAQIERGADAQPLARVLRQELSYALERLYKWYVAKWGGQPS